MPMMQEKPKEKKPPDMVGRLQEVARKEIERKKAEDEAKKKKPAGVNTAPSDGIVSRMYKYWTGSDKEKK